MPPCVLAQNGHKQSLPVCSEAHRPVGWARKQARVRRRCCDAGGAGGGGREEGGARLVQHALTLLWTPRWRRRWSRTTRRWTRWRRKLRWRRQRTSMAFPITSYRVTISHVLSLSETPSPTGSHTYKLPGAALTIANSQKTLQRRYSQGTSFCCAVKSFIKHTTTQF